MSRDKPQKPTIRKTPRISVNKLAEYLTASPAKRRSIVKDQKYPPTFRITWYEKATRAMVSFLSDPKRDDDALVQVIEKLYTQKAATENEQLKLNTNAQALEAFLEGYSDLDLGLGVVKQGDADPAKLSISGVELSVRPELLLQSSDKSKRGAIKLYLSKDQALDDSTGQYIAAVVERFVVDQYGPSASRKHCQVFDVFGRSVQSAPASTKARMKDIEAACQEIALLWTVV